MKVKHDLKKDVLEFDERNKIINFEKDVIKFEIYNSNEILVDYIPIKRLLTAQKMKFSIKETADLVIITKETRNGKLYFLGSGCTTLSSASCRRKYFDDSSIRKM